VRLTQKLSVRSCNNGRSSYNLTEPARFTSLSLDTRAGFYP
jgi:hypothetical protein